jgi:predicted dehydrogenase
MIKISLALIGAGDRGMTAYAPYALSKPHEAGFVAVAEPDRQKRESFRQQHGIKEEDCFSDYKDLFNKPKLADAVLICTQDRMHVRADYESIRKRISCNA